MTIRRRARVAGERPWLTRADLAFAAELPWLATVARAVPERGWRDACRRLESVKARLGITDPAPVALAMRRALAGDVPGLDAHDLALEAAAGRSEHHVQVLRANLGGWDPSIALDGERRLAEALERGRGAVLWVAHFCFNALATKQALASAGYRAWHVSRPEHGFSTSRLGIATVNRLRVRAELTHLGGRIVIDRSKPMVAMRAAQRVLRGNGIVSITAGAWEGTRLAAVSVLGGTIELAVGAPGLARLADAPLLPVFTVRDDAGVLRVVVEPPIAVAREGAIDSALDAASQAFARGLEVYVRRYAAQWRDWKSLRLAG